MSKIRQWWNTPLSEVFDNPDTKKYSIIFLICVLVIVILLIGFISLSRINTTTTTQIYTDSNVNTTVSQVNTNTTQIPNIINILYDTKAFGNTPILYIMFIGVPIFIAGGFFRRQMRWIMFFIIQIFCLIMFGVSIWTVILPMLFLISSMAVNRNEW